MNEGVQNCRRTSGRPRPGVVDRACGSLHPRALCSRALAVLLIFGLGLCVSLEAAWAQGSSARACSEAFESWVRRSQDTLKAHAKTPEGPGLPSSEACIPSESVRKNLLKLLDTVRRRCEALEQGSDDVVATKPLIEINADVIGTVPVCRTTVASVPSVPPSAAKSCLSITSEQGVHWLANKSCPGSNVVAVVEIKLASGERRCRGHVVSKSAKLGTVKPALNYECVQNGRDCSVESVKEIFPYCSW